MNGAAATPGDVPRTTRSGVSPVAPIGDIGTIAFFQVTGIPWPTNAIMILAIINGLLTSFALETMVLSRLMVFRIALKTALGMSLISMISMEAVMNITDVALTGGGKANLVGSADNVGSWVSDTSSVQLLAAQSSR